jgi:hypothetical protein
MKERTVRVIYLRLLFTGALLGALLIIGAFGRLAHGMPHVASVAIAAHR